MTILIVDDNDGIRRVIRHALKDIAKAVWECSDGAGALADYKMHHPDIVLMDIRMPGVDGLEATRRILRNDPSARIVIVTDYEDEVLRAAAQEAGARGYAPKLNLLDLPATILSIFGR
jgi:DNA-binding NarL/FixJ family response regulator